MKYEELYKDFISLFPDDKPFFDELCKQTSAEETDGMYIMFSFVVVPFIKKIVIESPEKTQRAFDFFEKMENSNDDNIAGLLEGTIIENILTDETYNFDIYVPYFGKETEEAAHAVARWFDVPY